MAETQIDPLVALYELVKAREPARGYTALDDEGRKAYQREAMRRSREKRRAALSEGRPVPDKASIRDALADAAIMLLATDAPGSSEIRSALLTIFGSDRPGVPMTVTADCKTGKLRPKLLQSTRK